MTDKIDVEIDATTTKAVRALSDLIDKLGTLEAKGPASAKAIQAVEKSALKIATSLAAGTRSINQQSEAIQNLIQSYKGLAGAGGAGGGITQRLNNSVADAAKQEAARVAAEVAKMSNQNAALKPLPKSKSPGSAFNNETNAQIAAAVALEKQRADALNKSAMAQQRFNDYQKASNARQAALEARDLANSHKALTAQMNASAAAQDRISKAQVAYARTAGKNNYGRDTNIAGLANQRYALYDVATTWGLVATATLGASAAVVKVGIDYQKNFATVQRTVGGTQESLRELKNELIGLTTEIPESFANITAIASLGGQLGIGAAGITEFTDVVAKLTATTNLTAEAAGTALGRFKALLGTTDSEFEAVASAILKVGVNSVATETQIVNTATQVSSMGKLAGFTAEQVVGLSGALASVGAAPELARGTVTRVFTNMAVAVNAGGESLDEFARLSGVSAEQFRSTWGTAAFAQTFQKFLAGIGTEGQAAIGTLNNLGISSVRDVPLLLRLAGAGNVVTQSFADSASGFLDADELQKQYAITLNTVASKLTLLGNTLKAMANNVGGSVLDPLAGFLDVITNLAKTLTALGSTGAGKVIGVLVLAIGTLVGGLIALRAAQALATASAYAFITAEEALSAHTAKSGLSMQSMLAKVIALTVGLDRATAAQEAFNASTASGSGKIASAAKGAAAAVGGLGNALKSAAVAGGWLLAIGAGIAIMSSFAQANQQAKADVDALTASLDKQTGAFTANTREQVKAMLETQGALVAAQQLGLTTKIVTDALLGSASARDKVADAIQRVRDKEQDAATSPELYTKNLVRLGDAANKLERVMPALEKRVQDSKEKFDRLSEGTENAGAGMSEMGDESVDLVGALQDILDVQYELIGGTVAVQNALSGLGQSLAENGTSFDAYSVGGRANLQALQGVMSAMAAASGGDAAVLATNLAGLMQSLASYGVNTVQQLGFVQQAIASMVGGKTIGLASINDAALKAGNGINQGFSTGAKKIAKTGGAANKAAKEIRTLSDYVSDLSSVFRDAFDFRFGTLQAVDKVAAQWQQMVDSANDAREAVVDATQAIVQSDATIAGLNAANNTLNYQLGIANQFGDVLRAAEITAELAKNNADLTEEQQARLKSQKDLTKAQAAALPSLDGQTESSREQRDAVLSLLQAYQGQVLALANQGLSQQEVSRRTAELKQQFVNQLTQMGYNRAEVDRFSAAFDDLTYAISKVPRNLTVNTNADTGPAQRAIDEFLAKNAGKSVSLGAGLNAPGADTTYGMGVGAGTAYVNGWNEAVQSRRTLITQADPHLPGGYRYSTDGGQHWFLRKGGQVGSGAQYHSTGGVHGMHPGAPKGTDTTPAWLTPGEFVMQKSAVQALGLPFMNALNNQQVPKYLASGGSASGGSNPGGMIQLVEILPTQVQQIIQGVSQEMRLDGRLITEATNANNVSSARRGSN